MENIGNYNNYNRNDLKKLYFPLANFPATSVSRAFHAYNKDEIFEPFGGPVAKSPLTETKQEFLLRNMQLQVN